MVSVGFTAVQRQGSEYGTALSRACALAPDVSLE